MILVMECGSIDLAGFLRRNRTKITKNELQVFWRQMLEAVHVIHEARIIHSDLKPANISCKVAKIFNLRYQIKLCMYVCMYVTFFWWKDA